MITYIDKDLEYLLFVKSNRAYSKICKNNIST